MARKCLVCRKTYKKIESRSFFRLPSDIFKREVWLQNLFLKEVDVCGIKEARICSDHFQPEDMYTTINGKNTLKFNAVPIKATGFQEFNCTVLEHDMQVASTSTSCTLEKIDEVRRPLPIESDSTDTASEWRHVKDIHPSDLEELALLSKNSKKKYTCSKCTKRYDTVRFLRIHEKKDHNVDYVPEQQLNYCPICGYMGFQKRNMILHFNQQHHIKMEETECNFTTIEEFSHWKSKIESDTRCKFLKRGGCSSKRKTRFFYFLCHRSGVPQIKTRRKRNLKKQEFIKINGLCPASMTVKCEPNGNVKVKYVQTHVGHTVNLGLATSLKDIKREAERDKVKSENTNNLEATLVDIKDEAEEGYIIEIFKEEFENTSLEDDIDELDTEWSCIVKSITNRNQIQAVKNHLISMKNSVESLENPNEITFFYTV